MIDLARSPEQMGNIIRRARKRRGMSQSELGEKTGLRQGTISLIEKGNPAVKLETILSVLAALDLDLQVNARIHSSIQNFMDDLSRFSTENKHLIQTAKEMGRNEKGKPPNTFDKLIEKKNGEE